MRRSNRLIWILTITLTAGMVHTDFLLKKAYSKINVNDPDKNYQVLAVKPFRSLHLRGGNAYAIHLLPSDSFKIKVMKTRRGFLNMRQDGDNLFIEFTVPKTTLRDDADKLPAGLVIYTPSLRSVESAGTAVFMNRLDMDSLSIVQRADAILLTDGCRIRHFQINSEANSWCNLRSGNEITHLDIHATGDAGINLKGVKFQLLNTKLKDNGKVICYEGTWGPLQ